MRVAEHSLGWRFVALTAFALVSGCGEEPTTPASIQERAPLQQRIVLSADSFVSSARPEGFTVSASVIPQPIPFIRVAGIGGNFGLQAANTVFSSGDLAGSVTRITEAQFNAMSVATLRSNYDVLLFTWASNPVLDANWTTRLLPFLNLGGGIIWEDDGNLPDLAPEISATCCGGFGWSVTSVPGLSDGISGAFANSHIRFTAWSSTLSPFITTGGGAVVEGLYGEYTNGGRIVLTGPDHDYHSHRPSDQYNLLVKEIAWVTGGPRNQAPTANPGGAYTGTEGSPVSFDGTASSDPDGDALSYNWDFGDGSPAATGATPSHSYADNGIYTVTLTVLDGKGGRHSASTTATIGNVAPSVGALTVPSGPLALASGGTVVTISAPYTDPGTADTHTAALACDGGTPGVVAASGGSASGNCTFAAAGVYTVALTVTDDDGDSDTETAATYIVVYDPSAGFVTGGGWITSPAGAYVDDATLTGKATFGFVSKYLKGATTPTGNTEFQFHAASFEFASSSYEWLVIAGARAQYKGEGTVKGRAGNVGFLLTAIDGAVSGGGGVDKFRIKIWDKGTGVVIYDNQTGQTDESGAATALGGGSIVVHAK